MKIRLSMSSVVMVFALVACAEGNGLDAQVAAAQKEGKMVMLELGSVGCASCEQMKPVMAKLSDAYRGRLEVIFIDMKKDHDTARRYGVYMIPVQVFLDKHGKEFHRHVGFYPVREIEPVLKKAGL